MPLAAAYIIRIHLPLYKIHYDPQVDTIADIIKRGDTYISAILALIAAFHGIGTLGDFDNVYEIGWGAEGFTRGLNAIPTQGKVHPALVLTTYAIGVSLSDVENFIAQVIAIHPWEHPVIECITPTGALIWLP